MEEGPLRRLIAVVLYMSNVSHRPQTFDPTTSTHFPTAAHVPQPVLPPMHARRGNPFLHLRVQLPPVSLQLARRVRLPGRRHVHRLSPIVVVLLLPIAADAAIADAAPIVVVVVAFAGGADGGGGAVPQVEMRALQRLLQRKGLGGRALGDRCTGE